MLWSFGDLRPILAGTRMRMQQYDDTAVFDDLWL